MIKEVDIHRAVDAIRAGVDAFILIPVEKVLRTTEFFDAGRYCIDEPEQPKKPEPVQRNPAPNAVDLDYLKVIELRKAGLSYDAIGDKFGCSGVTVSNFLRREGQKRREAANGR